MSKHHDLKLLPVYFKQVDLGFKTYEIRKNDRDYQQGDTAALNEYDPELGYSGMVIYCDIGFVTPLDKFYGPQNDYVVFSILNKRYVP